MKKVCVFVDGENFRHSIEELFPADFNKNEYLPKQAKWASFFDWMVDLASNGESERLRTYWYVIDIVDFFPYKLPSITRAPGTLRTVLEKHQPLRDTLRDLDGDDLVAAMVDMAGGLEKDMAVFRKRFDGWKVIQDGISIQHDAVEFRRAGAISYNLFRHRLGQEKAVDVKLAADLIMLRDIYDIAVIVSGDQDYVPAVQVVKDAGKAVVNVTFLKPDGGVLPGGARRLNQMTDTCLEVPYHKVKEYLLPVSAPAATATAP